MRLEGLLPRYRWGDCLPLLPVALPLQRGEDLMPLILCPRCPHCGIQSQLHMLHEEVARMNAGLHIQETLPDWPPYKREMLMTGIHQHCWDELFKEPEDDE
jgi:hypothetical protein